MYDWYTAQQKNPKMLGKTSYLHDPFTARTKQKKNQD